MSNIYGDFLRDPDAANAPVVAGDYNDDDAKYVDLLLEENDAPTPAELPRDEQAGMATVPTKTPNRMICRTFSFTGPMSKAQLGLPADVNRKRLQILIDSAYFWIATEPNFIPNPDGTTNLDQPNYGLAALVGANVELVDYTGPIYFINGASTGAASKNRIIFMAITE